MIKISGSYTFQATQTEVWSRIIDPDELVKLIPGCESLTEIRPGTYQGLITLALPAVSGEFDTLVSIELLRPPAECHFSGEISGSSGRITGRALLRLAEQPEDTLLNYEAEGVITGALAKLPKRVIEAVAQTLLKQGLSKLNRDLQT